MKKPKEKPETYSKAEAKRRFDAALLGARKLPAKSQKRKKPGK